MSWLRVRDAVIRAVCDERSSWVWVDLPSTLWRSAERTDGRTDVRSPSLGFPQCPSRWRPPAAAQRRTAADHTGVQGSGPPPMTGKTCCELFTNPARKFRHGEHFPSDCCGFVYGSVHASQMSKQRANWRLSKRQKFIRLVAFDVASTCCRWWRVLLSRSEIRDVQWWANHKSNH